MQFFCIFSVNRQLWCSDCFCTHSVFRYYSLQVEVLSCCRRNISRNCLQRSAPHTGKHIYNERECYQSKEQTWYTDFFQWFIAFEAKFSQKIKSQHGEYHYPQGKIGFSVQDTPACGQVCHRQELQSQSYFNKSEYYFHGIEPWTGLQVLQNRRKHCQKGEWQCKSDGKSEHWDQKYPAVARSWCHFYQCSSQNGTCAGEWDQYGGQSYEECSQITAFICFLVRFVYQSARHGDLKQAKERESENHEDDKEDKVWYPVSWDDVHRIFAQQKRQCQSQNGKHKYYACSKEVSLTATLFARFVSLHEERYCHRNHRENTRCDKCQQSCGKGNEEHSPRRFVFGCLCLSRYRGFCLSNFCTLRCNRLFFFAKSFLCLLICYFWGCSNWGCHIEIWISFYVKAVRHLIRRNTTSLFAQLKLNTSLNLEVLVGFYLNSLTEGNVFLEKSGRILCKNIILCYCRRFFHSPYSLIKIAFVKREYYRVFCAFGVLWIDVPIARKFAMQNQFGNRIIDFLGLEVPLCRTLSINSHWQD